jgi:predicted PurR-regulated permease PerM
VVGRITGVFSVAVTAVGGIILLLFLGLFLAAEPDWYLRGVVQLFPLARRARIRAVLARVGQRLWMWLLGGIALRRCADGHRPAPARYALGVHPGPHCLRAPNIGPILSGVPAVLLALLKSPTLAIYVIVLYVVIQSVESYLVTPLIQRRVVSLPPALTLTAQLLLAGFLGLFLATPLTVVAMVLIEELYIKDVLEENEG